ncbi:DUF779 domain-containing protein [Variovorax sp. WS11]|uniref:DUF779 domain-containing protein n=1 Tax=Variovorax sp. WS11 TaxID=1105204 RepID=UPI000D0D8438|nr:DUF779 domain-containing protein [Variovorax sp. WS11]NDZ18462.1 DUF779 domain-containing protein [Variovorax sp. WS11]PSL85108.1 DUF779 domain-containing protein [Variovorax sp. WS11]
MSSDPGAPEAPCGIVRRVSATPAAQALIERLRAVHGPLMFHQSGGCCDGSAPMCFALGEFQTGDADVCLGEIAGAPFYMSRAQFAYWEHTHLIIDAVPGNGGMFSLERPTGLRFITRSRLYDDAEWKRLEAQGNC